MNHFLRYLSTIAFALLLLIVPGFTYAQTGSEDTELILSLEEAIGLAMEQNHTLEQAQYEVDKNKAKFRQTRAVFLPQLSLEYNAVSTNDPLNVFGFKLKQEVVTQEDFNPDILNDPGSYENYSASIEVRQPLINPDMFFQRGAARSNMLSSEEQLNGTKNRIRYQVSNHYYKLILNTGQVDVLETALKTAAEHRRQAENLFGEGMLSKEDYLAARVYELEMESRLMNTGNQLEDTQEEMALMLGLDDSRKIIAADTLDEVEDAISVADITRRGIDNAALRAIDQRVQAAESMVRSAQLRFLPTINAFGSYEYHDPDFGGFGASSYMVGINLRWNLFSGFRQAGKIQEARADFNRAQSVKAQYTKEMSNRVRRASRSLDHARKELELAEQSIISAEEDVTIRSNRYQEGLERTTDLLEAETRLAEARLKQIMARYQYRISIAMLEMLLEEEF